MRKTFVNNERNGITIERKNFWHWKNGQINRNAKSSLWNGKTGGNNKRKPAILFVNIHKRGIVIFLSGITWTCICADGLFRICLYVNKRTFHVFYFGF